ncbi:hypothetical protein V5799_012876 [Amblyomma americanum]|uniref:Uncharacterized protein n=1 Tax=Amblyomma americanum TaxID=6943 RepID=A0AAQ4E7L0_AMBAM
MQTIFNKDFILRSRSFNADYNALRQSILLSICCCQTLNNLLEPEGFQDLIFPFGLHGGTEEGEELDREPSVEPDDRSDFEPLEGTGYYDYDSEFFQDMRYAMLPQPPPPRGAYGYERDDEGFGGLYADDDPDDWPPHGLRTEGRGDVALEQNPWEGLQGPYYGPMVSSYGTVSVFLRQNVRVDISVDRAVRVVNFAMHCTAAFSSSGTRCCACHPCGRVLQEGSDVHMSTGNRLGKISSRGITFTALNHGLVYLVDASGTKSTTERFHDLGYDLPLSMLNIEVEPDMDSFNECFEIVSQARRRTTRNGDEIWNLGGVRIKQTPWGDVQVSRDSGRRVIWTSPTAGSVSVTTPLVKIALSSDPRKFFFVRTGAKRICANSDGFIVRNGSQRAGFDRRGRLTLP